MKIFQVIQKLFKISGIQPRQPDRQYPLNWRTVLSLYFLAESFIFSGTFFFFQAKTMSEYADSYYALTIALVQFFNFSSISFNIAKIEKLIENFENAIQKRLENPTSRAIYVEVNEKIEKWSSLLFLSFVKISLPSLLMPNLFLSFWNYFIAGQGSDAFVLPFPMSLPFDWKTPMGYLVAFSLESASIFCVFQTATFNISCLSGTCDILASFATDIEINISALGMNDRITNTGTKLKKKLAELLQLHAQAKQFAKEYSGIHKLVIMFSFLWGLSTVCNTLLMVQTEISKSSVGALELVKPFVLIFWAFASMFLMCQVAENVTNRFDALNDAIWQTEWYCFPIGIQKIWPTIMMDTQEPVFIRGFGNVLCTRETFKKIANSGFSYYTLLRKL